jgi:hypothetical protein
MASSNIEVVFSFDTTGSMYPCLTQVRRNLSSNPKAVMVHKYKAVLEGRGFRPKFSMNKKSQARGG